MRLLFLSFFLVFGRTAPAGESPVRVKLFCLFTPEFQILYERYFLPSIQDDFDVIVREYPQECPTGVYRSEGWDKTMIHKLEMLQDAAIGCAENQVFIYADVDIIFLKPALPALLECLGTNDFVVQQGWPRRGLCAGLIVLRANEKTSTWIKRARALLERKMCPDDQVALQRSLESFREGEISWAFLPSEQFPNGRRVLKAYSQEKNQLYTRDSELALDDSIVLFHANCCLGLEDTCHFLTRVQEEYLKNRCHL